MSSKLIKKLRREAKANPKKVVILAVLFLVAVYFWVPLIMPAPDEQQLTATPGLAAASAPAAPATSNTNSAPATVTHPWRQVVGWIDADPRMKPGAVGQIRRNPFAAQPDSVQQQQMAEPELAETEVSPAEAGWKLSSTIIGPRGRVAVLEGKRYELGDEVLAGPDGEVAFVLAEVHPRRIVLERAGKRYELRLLQPALANEDYLGMTSRSDELGTEPDGAGAGVAPAHN